MCDNCCNKIGEMCDFHRNRLGDRVWRYTVKEKCNVKNKTKKSYEQEIKEFAKKHLNASKNVIIKGSENAEQQELDLKKLHQDLKKKTQGSKIFTHEMDMLICDRTRKAYLIAEKFGLTTRQVDYRRNYLKRLGLVR